MTRSGRQVVEAAYEALLGRGDLEEFLVDFDEETEMVEAASLPYGGTWTGRDAIRAAIKNVFGYWRDFSYEVHQITEGGDWVIAYGTFSATSTSTGRSVSMPLAESWRIVDGKVRFLFPLYSDTQAAIQALG